MRVSERGVRERESRERGRENARERTKKKKKHQQAVLNPEAGPKDRAANSVVFSRGC